MDIKCMKARCVNGHWKTKRVLSVIGILFTVISMVIQAADSTQTQAAATSIQRKNEQYEELEAKKEVYREPTRGSRASNAIVVQDAANLMSNNEIRDIMISESIRINRPCACPYSPDAIGGQCGTESKYYKPGGFRIYCYRIDISSEEVYFYRLRRAYRFDRKQQVYIVPSQQSDKDPTSNYFRNNAPSLENKRRKNAVADMVSNPNADSTDPTANYFKNNAEGYYRPSNNNFPANNPTSSSTSTGAINYQYNPYNPYGATTN